MPNSSQVGKQVSTRRTKRKVLEVDNASPGKSSKRPMSTVSATQKKGARRNSIPASTTSLRNKHARGNQSGTVDRGSTSTKVPSKEKLGQLIKKSNLSADAISLLQGHLEGAGIVKSSSKCHNKPNKAHKRAAHSSRRASIGHIDDDDDSDDDDEDDHDVESEFVQQQQHEDSDKDALDDSDLELLDDGVATTAANHGLSDSEEDVPIILPNEVSEEDGEHEDDVDDLSSAPVPSSSRDDDPAATSPVAEPTATKPAEPSHLERSTEELDAAAHNLTRGGVDDSIFLNHVQLLQRAIIEQFETSFAQVLSEIRSDRDNIKRLREHVSELSSVVTTTVGRMFVKNMSSNPRVKEIQKKLCLLPALFNDQLMLKVIPRVVTGFLVTNIKDGSSNEELGMKGVEYFSVLYFSIQPNEKKDKYDSHVGRIYSMFRHSLLLSSFLAMQENTFKVFKDDNLETGALDPLTSTDGETSTVIANVTAMLQPFWLKPGYILSEHCISASKKQEKRGGNEKSDDRQEAGDMSQTTADSESVDLPESSQSSGGKLKTTRSGPLTREEIAVEAALMLYKVITSVLYRSRAASRIQLFHDLTYLFTGWSRHNAPVDQNSLKISWGSKMTSNVDYMARLPRTKIIRPHDRHSLLRQEISQIDLDNLAHLEKLISDHPELSLDIQHDVLVNGTRRTLRFRLNLIEVACRSLAAYCTLESASKGKDALCSDKRCFQAIIVLALGLRRLIMHAIEDLNSSDSVPWTNNNNSGMKAKRGQPRRSCNATTNSIGQRDNQYIFSDINGMRLDQILPPPSKQKELLNQMVLNMTEEEFSSKTRTDGTPGNTLNNNFGAVLLGSTNERIQVNEHEGVFGF